MNGLLTFFGFMLVWAAAMWFVPTRGATGMWPGLPMRRAVMEQHLAVLVALCRAGEMQAEDACEDFQRFTRGQYLRFGRIYIARLFAAERAYRDEWFNERTPATRTGWLNGRLPEYRDPAA